MIAGQLTPTDSITHAVLEVLEKNRAFLDSTGSMLRGVELVVKMDMRHGGAGLVLFQPNFEHTVKSA